MDTENLNAENTIEEIASLNLADLEVVEIERRFEMAAAIPNPIVYGTKCGFNCTCFFATKG